MRILFLLWSVVDIGGLEDMKLTYGTIVAERKVKQGKEGKV